MGMKWDKRGTIGKSAEGDGMQSYHDTVHVFVYMCVCVSVA